MQYTVRGKLLPSKEETFLLDTMCRVFMSMVRFAYKRLLQGLKYYEVTRILYDVFIPNARWCQWAVEEAEALKEAMEELLPVLVEEYNRKIELIKKKIEKQRHPLKRKGLEKKLRKFERRKAKLEKHIENGTLPSVVFGSKRLFKKLTKKKNVKDEWLLKRRSSFFSVGQRNKGGNANTRIFKDSNEEYWLEVRNWFKEDFKVRLYIPPIYRPYIENLLERCEKYTVRVKKISAENYQCLITFELKEPLVTWNGDNIAGLDINPTGVAVTIVKPDGNLLASKWFYKPDLVYARKEKRKWIAGNLIKQIFTWIRSFNVNTVALEKLNLSNTYEYPSWVNRIIANFMRKKLVQLVKTRTIKEKMLLIEVNPAYTSKIAETKYSRNYARFNRHQLAAFVIARRALGYGEKLPKPIKIKAKMVRKEGGKKTEYWKVIYISGLLYGHAGLHQMASSPTNGRMGFEADGVASRGSRVTPHTLTTPNNSPGGMRMKGFRGGCQPNEGWGAGHRGNPARAPTPASPT